MASLTARLENFRRLWRRTGVDPAEDRARGGCGLWRKARPDPGAVWSLNTTVPIPVLASGPGRCRTAGTRGFGNNLVWARWFTVQEYRRWLGHCTPLF
jgi:hypothetical protein